MKGIKALCGYMTIPQDGAGIVSSAATTASVTKPPAQIRHVTENQKSANFA